MLLSALCCSWQPWCSLTCPPSPPRSALPPCLTCMLQTCAQRYSAISDKRRSPQALAMYQCRFWSSWLSLLTQSSSQTSSSKKLEVSQLLCLLDTRLGVQKFCSRRFPLRLRNTSGKSKTATISCQTNLVQLLPCI